MVGMNVEGKAVLLAIIVLLAVTGCSYTVTTDISPATTIYSNYPDRIAGRWALHVDAEDMAGSSGASGLWCSDQAYHFDARNAFMVSVERTLQNIMEDVEVVSRPLHGDAIPVHGFKGMVRIEARDLKVDLAHIGFLTSATMIADTKLTASVVVYGADGRLMGTTVEGDGRYRAQTALACGGGATAIGKAIEDAMKETLGRLGESLSDSHRLR